MKKITLTSILFFCAFIALSATIDSLGVFSEKMNKTISVIVVAPEIEGGNSVPTLYLLHGHGGNQNTWSKLQDLKTLSDQYGMLIVCPYGENSWYWDSPTNSSSQFETFISKELPTAIDERYSTIKSPSSRAITGLSMGGHGAMWNALRHPEVFGAAGSTSGGLDVRPFPNNWNMKEQLGELSQNKEVWDNHSVLPILEDIKQCELAIIIDCGVDDFFLDVNRNAHNALLKNGIQHDYIERPGAHNGKYWSNSILYQILFFHNFFSQNK